MKRSAWWRCFKASHVYSVDDIIDILGVTRNTVSNHIRHGLRPVDTSIPKLFVGSELIRFHRDRSTISKRARRPGEFICFKCRAFVLPEPEAIEIERSSASGRVRLPLAKAVCPECGGRLSRIVSEMRCDDLGQGHQSKISWESQDEYAARFPAEFGNQSSLSTSVWNKNNERLIHGFIIFCRQFNPKTTYALLVAVREMEAFCGLKDLNSYTIDDVDRYRTELRRRANPSEADPLSTSTLRHRASHIRRFLEWLIKQDGMEKLPRALPEYVILSKADTARSIKPTAKAYPTDDEAVRLVSAMPGKTLIERRDKAIVATSFLLGTRADATASLKIKHIDLESRSAYQIATESRIKNSKTQTTWFFPGDSIFVEVLTKWVRELERLGAMGDDALFPPDQELGRVAHWTFRGDKPIAPWTSSRGVEKAFRRASEAADLPYFNPHSARHNVFFRKDKYCSTWRQRKAWSHNGGHESEAITERNYAKMTDEECRQVFSELTQSTGETLEDKDLMIDLQLGKLFPGTPEHARATRLVRARMDRG